MFNKEDEGHYFQYSSKVLEDLKSKDSKLAEAIDRIGLIQREIMPEPFSAMVFSVISQLISKKAANTVWGRLNLLVEAVTPNELAAAELEDIIQCGMTRRKAETIKALAVAEISGEIDFSKLHLLSDDEIIQTLSAFKGIGVWTAEMLLIFTLNRMDVVSYNDLAIRKGIMKLYGLEKLTKKEFNEYRERYSPYGSVASLYLWEISTW